MIRTLIHIALITAKAVLALITTILIVPGLVERFQSSNRMGCSKRPHPCDGKSKMQLCGFMESVV
jgi:hypothetical protein